MLNGIISIYWGNLLLSVGWEWMTVSQKAAIMRVNYGNSISCYMSAVWKSAIRHNKCHTGWYPCHATLRIKYKWIDADFLSEGLDWPTGRQICVKWWPLFWTKCYWQTDISHIRPVMRKSLHFMALSSHRHTQQDVPFWKMTNEDACHWQQNVPYSKMTNDAGQNWMIHLVDKFIFISSNFVTCDGRGTAMPLVKKMDRLFFGALSLSYLIMLTYPSW